MNKFGGLFGIDSAYRDIFPAVLGRLNCSLVYVCLSFKGIFEDFLELVDLSFDITT